MPDSISVVAYSPEYRETFKKLNLAWIEQYFRVEKKDLEQVNHPEKCLAAGGQIIFAVQDGVAVGTCAAYPAGPGQYEIAKMAVAAETRGLGIGDRLMEAIESWIRRQGATEILILSNTVLEPAIKLYKKHRYQVTHLGPHPDYERCNIELRKQL